MADRDSALRGLAEISEYMKARADIADVVGVGKEKEIFDSWYRATEDALALLREQEPRVMTLEEVETLPYGYVLIETDKQDSLRWLDALLFSKNANFSFDFITLEGRARLLGTEYNREWRCWTARPTNEQREAVKWDADAAD